MAQAMLPRRIGAAAYQLVFPSGLTVVLRMGALIAWMHLRITPCALLLSLLVHNVRSSTSVVPQLAHDMCFNYFFRDTERLPFSPRCRRHLPDLRLRRRNASDGWFEWRATPAKPRVVGGMIKLARSYKMTDMAAWRFHDAGAFTFPELMRRAECVQMYYSQEEHGTNFRFWKYELLFNVFREFAAFPPLPNGQRSVHPGLQPDVYVLILDSVSRRTMRHFMPAVHNIFHKDLPDHLSFHFPSFHTICGGGTLSTVYPMFHGGVNVRGTPKWCSEGMQDSLPWKHNYSTNEACYDPRRRILKLAREAGYVVSLGTNLLFQLYNDLEDPHHATCPAVCASINELGDFSIDANFSLPDNAASACLDSLCFDRETYAKKVLEFNQDVFKSYPDYPKFVVSMLHGAHRSAVDLVQLEAELLKHFASIQRQGSPFRESVVILMGDHGAKTVACDYGNPFLGILAPRTLETTDFGRVAIEALRRNAELSAKGVLVTPWDLYATLRHLIAWGRSSGDSDHFDMSAIRAYGDIQTHTEMHGRAFLTHTSDVSATIQEAFGRFSASGEFAPRSIFASLPGERSCEAAGVAWGHCVQGASEFGVYGCQQELRRLLARERDQALKVGLGELPPRISAMGVTALERAFYGTGVPPDVVEGRIGEEPTTTGPEFWCRAAISRALEALQTLNDMYTSRSQGICRTLTLRNIDHVQITISEGSLHSGVSVSITVGQGQPSSRYELTFRGHARPDVPSELWWSRMSAQAISRYAKYRPCTPPGIETEFCVCEV